MESLPLARPSRLPSYAALSTGPLRRRHLPGAARPLLVQYPVNGPPSRVIEVVGRHEVGDGWVAFDAPAMWEYLATGEPVLLTHRHEELIRHQLEGDGELAQVLDRLDRECGGRLATFQVGEWENWLHFDPVTVFGLTADEIRTLSRGEVHARVVDTFRRWKTDVRGRIHSVNGYGLISHVGAEVGEDVVGIESGENVPAAQVQRAFARGAARQFGLPWGEQISQWYRATVPTGRATGMVDLTPGGVHPTWVGPHTGHSANLLARLWYTAWFSGAAYVNIEASTGYLFDTVYGAPELPADCGLTEYGRLARQLRRLMEQVDPGIPYTPFGVLLRRDHGRMTYWRGPWHHQTETDGDRLTVAFFDQLFPGQSQGPGLEERYLCPSPWGDTCDVLVAGATAQAWSAYPVLIAVGEVPWTPADQTALREYVDQGGTLVLHEVNLVGWDRGFPGLEARRVEAAPGTQVVLRRSDGQARVLRRSAGTGQVLTVRHEPGLPPVPPELLAALTTAHLPFRPDPRVQTLINRTAKGWMVLLAHHAGWTKEPTEQAVADAAAGVHLRLELPARGLQTLDPTTGSDWQPLDAAGAGSVEVDLAPGGMRLLRWAE